LIYDFIKIFEHITFPNTVELWPCIYWSTLQHPFPLVYFIINNLNFKCDPYVYLFHILQLLTTYLFVVFLFNKYIFTSILSFLDNKFETVSFHNIYNFTILMFCKHINYLQVICYLNLLCSNIISFFLPFIIFPGFYSSKVNTILWRFKAISSSTGFSFSILHHKCYSFPWKSAMLLLHLIFLLHGVFCKTVFFNMTHVRCNQVIFGLQFVFFVNITCRNFLFPCLLDMPIFYDGPLWTDYRWYQHCDNIMWQTLCGCFFIAGCTVIFWFQLPILLKSQFHMLILCIIR
jgi:hypothetical protein